LALESDVEAFHDIHENTKLCKKVMDSIKERFQLCVNAEGGHFVTYVRK
jgi:hypothetical protein